MKQTNGEEMGVKISSQHFFVKVWAEADLKLPESIEFGA